MPGGFQPQPPALEITLVIRAWRLMGGIDWLALDTVAEIIGFKDIELLIAQLGAIRDFHGRE